MVHCAFVGKCPRYLRVENYHIALLGCSLCVLTAHKSIEIGALVLRSELVAALSRAIRELPCDALSGSGLTTRSPTRGSATAALARSLPTLRFSMPASVAYPPTDGPRHRRAGPGTRRGRRSWRFAFFRLRRPAAWGVRPAKARGRINQLSVVSCQLLVEKKRSLAINNRKRPFPFC